MRLFCQLDYERKSCAIFVNFISAQVLTGKRLDPGGNCSPGGWPKSEIGKGFKVGELSRITQPAFTNGLGNECDRKRDTRDGARSFLRLF
ncbi:MAG TPA: hypothetical protein ENJ30_07020 [Desulfobulbaceae bacterium]|nr:hypothetical protein [Desulfobulbaceae bacterium]